MSAYRLRGVTGRRLMTVKRIRGRALFEEEIPGLWVETLTCGHTLTTTDERRPQRRKCLACGRES